MTATDGSVNESEQAVRDRLSFPTRRSSDLTGPSGGSGAANSSVTVNENQTAVHTFSASEAVTWSLNGGEIGRASCRGRGGVLTFTSAPDYEAPTDADTNNSYVVVVRATDGSGNVSDQTVTVSVANLDEVATNITGPSGGAGAANSSVTVNENQTAVHTFSASEAVTWSLNGGADAGRFSVSAGGVLTFTSAPDYEAPTDADTNNSYVVVVRATDGSGNVSDQTVTVSVANLDEVAPNITGPSGGAGAANSSVTVNENQTAVHTFSASEAVTWSLNGRSEERRVGMGAGGGLTFTSSPDYEAPTDADTNNSYVVVVRATDGSGNVSDQTVTVSVANLDEVAPNITGASGGAGAANSSVTVNENQTAVHTFSASEAVTWSLNGGADAGRFSVSAGGVLTFTSAPDYEAPTDADTNNSYVVVVRATDGSGNVSDQTVTVSVANLD